VLAVFPSTRGFGYALFEGPEVLVDWGIKTVRGGKKNDASLRRIQELLDLYRPDTLIVEDYKGAGSRRAERIQKLIDAAIGLATKQRIVSQSFSRADIRTCFSHRGALSKRQIAETLAREFPELGPRLPPLRKIWMSEDARMNIFDAAALAMTFFDTRTGTKRAA